MIKAICFDLGGTLLYTRGETFSCRLSRLLGVPLSEIRPLVIKHFYIASLPLRDAVTAFCKEIRPDLRVSSSFLQMLHAPSSQALLYSDILAISRELQGYRLAIISNGTPWESASLTQLHIADLFEVEINSYEVGFAKPDPRIFQAAQYQLRLQSAEIAMVGDSVADDIAGARAVGWRAIHILRNDRLQPASLTAANAVVHSLWEVRRVVEQL